MNFVDYSLTKAHPNLLIPLERSLPLQYFDGSCSGSNITHYVLANMKFPDNTIQSLKFLVTKTHPLTPVVLGLDWL